VFVAKADGRSNKYKNGMHPQWIGPQQTSTQSNPSSRRWKPWEKNPWSKTSTKRPGAENYNKNIHETCDQKKAATENPKQTQQ